MALSWEFPYRGVLIDDGRLRFCEGHAPAPEFYSTRTLRSACCPCAQQAQSALSVLRSCEADEKRCYDQDAQSLQKEKGLVLLRAGLYMWMLKTAKKEMIEESDCERADGGND